MNVITFTLTNQSAQCVLIHCDRIIVWHAQLLPLSCRIFSNTCPITLLTRSQCVRVASILSSYCFSLFRQDADSK